MGGRTFGTTIAELRKEKGLTQLELANMMNVTDKAVSKWERDISYPDTASIPRLAEILGVSVDDLLKCKGTGQGKKIVRIDRWITQATGSDWGDIP